VSVVVDVGWWGGLGSVKGRGAGGGSRRGVCTVGGPLSLFFFFNIYIHCLAIRRRKEERGNCCGGWMADGA
jgi:hypothetical protein